MTDDRHDTARMSTQQIKDALEVHERPTLRGVHAAPRAGYPSPRRLAAVREVEAATMIAGRVEARARGAK